MWSRRLNIKLKAMSLIELLITLLIITLLTGIIIWLFLAGKKVWLASEVRVSLRQEMQIVTHRITRELQDSNLKLLTSVDNGSLKAFSFPSAFDDNGKFVTDSRGYPVWQKYLIYYLADDSTVLLKKTVKDKDFEEGLAEDELISYCDGTGVKAASSVEDFTFAINKEDENLGFSIKFKKKNRLGEVEEMSFETKVFILN